MPRPLIAVAVAFVLLAAGLFAQEGPQRGTVKKVDPDKGTITITVNGKDHEFTLDEDAHIQDAAGRGLKDGLKDPHFKEGTPVTFKAVRQGGKDVLVGIRVGAEGRPGQPAGGVRQGRLKKMDADKKTVTITADGRDLDLALTDRTQLFDRSLKDFKEGMPVMFVAGQQDGKAVLVGMKPAGSADARQRRPELKKVDTSKLKALPELGAGKYQGHEGGLYPGGKNERPADHEKAGLALAKQVRPLDADGKPSADGKIVLVSIGMSNTTQEFSTFKPLADRDPDKDPRLVIVDGAQGGMSAARIVDPKSDSGARFWGEVDRRLKQAGASRQQVQVAWIKQADAGPSEGFPRYAKNLQERLAKIAQILHERFPNLKLAYLSCRTYGGYARTPLNPEPYAYESGFSVKWLIEQQIKGDAGLNYDEDKGPVKAPWLSWGPYLWANGTTKNPDGLAYEQSDFVGDGTHPSPSGRRKVAEQLLHFFKTDSTAKIWFVKP
jgi:Cu/Ag efflux protein CusF